jgi:hypothetical protein
LVRLFQDGVTDGDSLAARLAQHPEFCSPLQSTTQDGQLLPPSAPQMAIGGTAFEPELSPPWITSLARRNDSPAT